jgi:hypothetical protein
MGALAMLLAGCGGRSALPAPNIDLDALGCVTSFVCAEGERCEGGHCVPDTDTDCPGSAGPVIILEQTEGLTGNIMALNGRRYWESSDPISAPLDATTTWFIDLETGKRSTFTHELGMATCVGDPAACVVRPKEGAVTLFTDVRLDPATQTWSAAASFTLPAGFDAFARDQPAPGQWLLWNDTDHTLASWQPGQADPDPLIAFGELRPLDGGVGEGNGLPKSIFGLHGALDGLAVAPLQKGASFTTLFSLPLGAAPNWIVPVPRGDGRWFVVHDWSDHPAYRVWRFDEDGQTEVGGTDDPLVLWAAMAHQLGSPALVGGSQGRATVCTDADGTCRAGVVDLSTLAVQPIASMAVHEPVHQLHLWARETRWLACNAVEMLVTGLVYEVEGGPLGMRIYWMRMVANGSN